jgi:hypothetical protein
LYGLAGYAGYYKKTWSGVYTVTLFRLLDRKKRYTIRILTVENTRTKKFIKILKNRR